MVRELTSALSHGAKDQQDGVDDSHLAKVLGDVDAAIGAGNGTAYNLANTNWDSPS